MIQLFLTLLLLVVLIIIINTKESFYQAVCPSNTFILNAINDYIVDDKNQKIPCIKLIPNDIINSPKGYIVIKEKNENISKIIDLSDIDILLEPNKQKNYINLTPTNSDIEKDKTYLITLNIENNKNIVDVYNTIEITFKGVILSSDDLTTKCKSNKDKLIESLKNKNIVFSL